MVVVSNDQLNAKTTPLVKYPPHSLFPNLHFLPIYGQERPGEGRWFASNFNPPHFALFFNSLFACFFAFGVKYRCTPWPGTCFNNTIVSKILNLTKNKNRKKSWVVIVQMTLGGPGCRLQTCRRREAQWFDSTFWAVQAPHFFAPDQPCPGFQVLFFQVPGLKI